MSSSRRLLRGEKRLNEAERDADTSRDRRPFLFHRQKMETRATNTTGFPRGGGGRLLSHRESEGNRREHQSLK